MKFLKAVAYLTGGIFWLLFGVGFAIFLCQFLARGAGLQLFGDFVPMVSAGSVLFGLIYFAGFSAASLICIAIGIYLLTRGITGTK